MKINVGAGCSNVSNGIFVPKTDHNSQWLGIRNTTHKCEDWDLGEGSSYQKSQIQEWALSWNYSKKMQPKVSSFGAEITDMSNLLYRSKLISLKEWGILNNELL